MTSLASRKSASLQNLRLFLTIRQYSTDFGMVFSQKKEVNFWVLSFFDVVFVNARLILQNNRFQRLATDK